MYQGDNKTALCSQKAIADALVCLLDGKPYSEITVSELCQQSGISRQTFYALFQTKENVLRFKMLNDYAYPEGIMPPPDWSAAQYLAHTFTVYTQANLDFLRLLVRNDLLYLYYDSCTQWLLEHQMPFLSALAPGRERYLAIFIGGTVSGAVNAYVTEPIPADQLERWICGVLDGRFFRQTITQDLRPMP